MAAEIILSRDEAREIFKALNGINELLKALPSGPEKAPVKYAIMSNLFVIRMTLSGVPRVNPN